jgi:15-cis-phytoene synthase
LAIYDAMADVVARSSLPALGAIKLAWWRERLEELDHGVVPAEPRLQLAAAELLPCGITGSALAQIEDGWAALLEPQPDMNRVADRGERLFEVGARLLGTDYTDDVLGAAGRLFADVDAARRGLTPVLPKRGGTATAPIPRAARPLTGLAALAARDLRRGGPPFESEGTPGRAWTLLRHRFTGRI